LATKPKPAQKYDVPAIIKALADAVERVGSDPVYYLSVVVGSFIALLGGVEPIAVIVLDALLIVGWVATKLINAYVKDRDAERALRQLTAIDGPKLLEKHRNRTREKQLPLLVESRERKSAKGIDSDG
jgi:hypothetical protein